MKILGFWRGEWVSDHTLVMWKERRKIEKGNISVLERLMGWVRLKMRIFLGIGYVKKNVCLYRKF